MARPKKIIDFELVEKLAGLFCTQAEIAAVLDISVRTLQRNAEFCRIYKKGLDNAKTTLRRNQLKLSERNATIAIWLGKQYLGQRDTPDGDNSTIRTVDFEFEIVSGDERPGEG